jgi:Hsp20/alpha crystallin family
MTATTSRGLPGNPRAVRDEVPRVVGGRGWRAGEKIHLSERGYGVFRRSLALPSSYVEADKTEASVRDGVLEILVPKAAEAQAALIRVRVSQGNAVPAPRLTPEGL